MTDYNSCPASNSFYVGEPPILTVSGTPTDALCKGDCNGSINIATSGGTSPYTYLWDNTPLSTTQNISNLCEGTYTVTIKDAHSCEVSKSWTISAPDKLDATGHVTDALCHDEFNCTGKIDITPVGGTTPYTYEWSTDPASTTQNISGLCSSTTPYYVTITDAHGCTTVKDWVVNQPGQVSYEGQQTDVTCKGACNGTITELITIGGTAPYTYQWDNGLTTKDLTGLCVGTYKLTVTDFHSCDARSEFVITEPKLLTVLPTAVIVDALCFNGTGGSIDITVTGGTVPYTYLWNNHATTEDISGLTPGWYTVNVTDYNSCPASNSFYVGEPPILTVTGAAKDALCNQSCDGYINIAPSGGTAPYTYLWDNTPRSTTQNISNLCAGTYTVTIKDAHSCEVVGSWPVSAPAPLVLQLHSITNVHAMAPAVERSTLVFQAALHPTLLFGAMALHLKIHVTDHIA